MIFLNIFFFVLIYSHLKKVMGCQPSQNSALLQGPEIRISIVDSAFMKSQYTHQRESLHASNITYEYFISLQYFFEEFSKRYYNKVVTNAQNYPQLKSRLSKVGLMPNIYIVRPPSTSDKKQSQLELSGNTIVLDSYETLAKHLKQNNTSTMALACHHKNALSPNLNANKKKVDVKILCKPGQRTSEQTIFESALSKNSISYEFYTSFQLLQQSLLQSTSRYIVTDYIFHKQVVQLISPSQSHTNIEPPTPNLTASAPNTAKPPFLKSKTKIVCYCDFDPSQTYSPELDFVSNNYLDIANDIKQQIKESQRNQVKCTKIYLNSNNLPQVNDIKEVIEDFGIQVRIFQNYEKVIQETVYLFAVTVVASESQIKNLTKFIQKNDYLQRTKILSISPNTVATPKSLAKLIRSIKKGYTIQKTITNSIDIIDKHYNNTKFQQVKKQLQANNIKCFGYSNINEYIKEKKFISPFLICNFEEKMLVVKYIKQLHSKAKIIVFCNKNKITNELKQNANFCYVSSHFGKIIKFIQKTQVYLPVINRHQELQFKQKIEKLRSKNKRISALKWSHISPNQLEIETEQNFQFLNIAKQTNQASIRDIQKSVATIWKTQSSILQLSTFKEQFIKSLKQLHKIHKINFSDVQFNQLIEKIKVATFGELLDKVRTFFDADNELGLEINKSLMKTQSLEKKQITHMREFLLLVFMNFFSGYQMARTGKKKIIRWVSNPLIQKCQIGSYLFCKHFVIFYQDSPQNSQISQLTKYKLELEQQHNPLLQSQLLYNSFIRYKDKTIFCPFSQFQVQDIVSHGEHTTIRIKYVKNVDFLKYIFQDNLLSHLNSSEQGQVTIQQFAQKLINKGNCVKSNEQQCMLVNQEIRDKFIANVQRVKAIELFKKGQTNQAIQIHQKIIKQIEQKQNLDSVLVNELNYELACFNFKANQNRQAGRIIKQLLQAQPGDYIKEECQKMIKQVTDTANQQQSQKNARRVSEEAMKTFEWLRDRDENQQNKEEDQDMKGRKKDNRNSKDQQSDSEDNGLGIFEHDVKCMEIGEIQGFDNLEIDKENIQQWQ